MTLDPEILSLLVCPETRSPLAHAEQALLGTLNGRIERGELQSHAGKPVTAALQEGLVREDGKCLYRVDDGIPNLLVDDRIDL